MQVFLHLTTCLNKYLGVGSEEINFLRTRIKFLIISFENNRQYTLRQFLKTNFESHFWLVDRIVILVVLF